jgi:phenylacetate-CoA ligase
MKITERFYSRMPIFIQNILISLYGLKLIFERYGRTYKKYKRELRKIYSFSKEQLIDYQREHLIKFLNYSKQRSIFYKEYYKDIDININCVTELKKLPILTKELLRENIDKIRIVKLNAIKGRTGGTTGKSLTVYFTKQDFQRRMAELDFFREMHGFKHRMKRATFSGKSIIPEKDVNSNIFWRDNYFLNQRFYSTFHLNDNNLPFYVQNLNKFKPKVIDGFPSAIYEIADFIERKNLTLDFKPIVIFATSETVTKAIREKIERVFNCKIRNQYASSEGAPFITECSEGNLHYLMHTGVIEVFDESTNEVLVTSFTTHGTPLIRYKIGDCIEFSDQQECNCGLQFPIVKSIQGRSTDFLFSPERGKINSANLSNVFKSIPYSIKKVQFIQEQIDSIRVKLVIDRSKFKNEHLEHIQEELRARLGLNINIKFEIVDEISREPSGKHRFIINKLEI